MTPFRVEICGGIASGKTTFANLFEGTGTLVLEDFTSVPFWQAFFDRPNSYNFETELSFLLQHYHQVKRAAIESQTGLVICDFAFMLDRAYAAVSLTGKKQHVFAAVLEDIVSEIGPPQLLVHLSCSPETEFRRIQARRRSAERAVTQDFLERLNSAVDAELAAVSSSDRVVRLNSDAQNFAEDIQAQEICRAAVLTTISKTVRGRPGEMHPSR